MSTFTRKSLKNSLLALLAIGLLLAGFLQTTYAAENIILNPEFDNGTTNWNLELTAPAAATMSVATNGGLSGTNSVFINITNAGTANYHVQLTQAIGIVSGKSYQISFMARATAPKTIHLILQQDVSPWTIYWSQYTLNLTTSAQTFGPYTFNSTVTDPAAKLRFLLSEGGDTDDPWIDKVEVIDTSAPTNTPTYTNTPTGPTNTPTNTPVPTNTPTNTPVPPTNTPTNTPLPTNTPTNTPVPTNTPTPTNTAPGGCGGNLVLNPEFDNGTTNWTLSLQGGGAGTMSVVTNGGLSGTNSLFVDVTNPGTASYHVQLNQQIGTTNGKTYQISFMAKANAPKTIDILIQQDASPWTIYWAEWNLNLTTSAQTFGPYTFNSTVTDPGARVRFNLASDVDDVWIDKVQVIDSACPTNTPTPSHTPTPTNTPGGPTPTRTNTPTGGQPPVNGSMSGKNWASGFFHPDQDWANFSQFGTWRGRALDVVLVYPVRDSWASITSPTSHIYTNFTGFTGRLIISVPLFPETIPNATGLSECAAGNYNSNWQTFGTSMVTANRANSIVRVGWEMNGFWFAWAASNTTNWINCFRNVVTAIRSTNPAVIIDWTMVGHGTSPGYCDNNVWNCWPGDAYVDIIGTDEYDEYPAALNATDFNNRANSIGGLNDINNFAVAHNKWIGVGEWSVSWRTGGNDNPLFIQMMHDWFEAHDFQSGGKFIYDVYFDDGCEPGYIQGRVGPWGPWPLCPGAANVNSSVTYNNNW